MNIFFYQVSRIAKGFCGFAFVSGLLFCNNVSAQCPGQLEVEIEVLTDDYGYEGYWQLTPGGNTCGTATVFAGGNALVGCLGGGIQQQQLGGYGNNLIITEGPWCFNPGSTYSIHYVDEYGDGGFTFRVLVSGFITHVYNGTGTGGTFTFTVNPPPANSAGIFDKVNSTLVQGRYFNPGPNNFEVLVSNYGTAIINSVQYSYQVDSETAVNGEVSGLSIGNYSSQLVTLPAGWIADAEGTYTITINLLGTNGVVDSDVSNNVIESVYVVGPAKPDIISSYINTEHTFTVIASATDNVNKPTDLDFHPQLTNAELWVINAGTAATGGSTVKIDNAGLSTQQEELAQDQNAWHFMSLPTGIAFSDNGNFATSPGVFNANHQPVNPFTGPTLWSSDPAIYAVENPGNGSHIDMLHESPYSQGVAWERKNCFWIFDGFSNDIVRYDFVNDHNPGNDDHSDAIIRRFADEEVLKDPQGVVPSHIEMDADKTWLYVVDNGNRRVIRINTLTGGPGPAPEFAQTEPLAEYSTVTGYTWETVVSTNLLKPCGIALMGNRMLISDFETGDIVIYDISSLPATEVERIETPALGITGIVIGPDGKIFYTDFTGNAVVRVEPGSVGIQTVNATYGIYPNPSGGSLSISGFPAKGIRMNIYNGTGQLVYSENNVTLNSPINPDVANGVYLVNLHDEKGAYLSAFKWVVNK